MILDSVINCDDATLAGVFYVVKNIMIIIEIIVPIILIVFAIANIISMMSNPDDKEGIKRIVYKFIAAMVVFFIPMLINASMGLVGESTELSSCWVNAKKVKYSSDYIPLDDEGKEKIDVTGKYDEKDIEKAKPEDPSSSSNSNNSSNTAVNQVVFIGDSRTVGMYSYLSNDWKKADYSKGGAHTVDKDVFIAQTSKGYSWMQSTGMPAANSYLKSGSALVFLMGVNDLHNADNYIKYVNTNYSNWNTNGVKVYFATVMPCSGSYSSLNKDIEGFNSKLKSNLSNGVKIIDTYQYLKSSGFKSTDGVHYDKETSLKVYNYIKSNL